TRPRLKDLLFYPLRPDKALLRTTLPQADFIFITHPHYDHLMDVPEIMRYTTAQVFGSSYAMQIIQANGIHPQRCHIVRPAAKLQAGSYSIQVLAGGHIYIPFFTQKSSLPKSRLPRRVWDYQMDACFSYALSTPPYTILIWHNTHGDRAPRADMLFLNSEIAPVELDVLLKNVQPHYIVPVHWDNFFRPLNRPLQPFIQPTHQLFPPIKRFNQQNFANLIQDIIPGTRIIFPKPLEFISDLLN
ncbi:MAG: MBL fold metallo-hydrolase, partial [Anaerolineales bacterium]